MTTNPKAPERVTEQKYRDVMHKLDVMRQASRFQMDFGVVRALILDYGAECAAQARSDALEEAAKVCDEVATRWDGNKWNFAKAAAEHCAKDIRSLSQPTTPEKG